ncbi:MAG: hypothetical protein V7641_2643 [Blastocatellia bacterium]
MLSVGRALYIQDQPVICLECEGIGAQLSTGHLQAWKMRGYVYAYCCAVCGTFEVRRKAKVLAFRQSAKSEGLEAPQRLTRNSI